VQADTLIAGATLVTVDATRRVIADGALAIDADRIVAVGPAAEIVPAVQARQVIDGRRFVVTPGFINGHVHITESLFKGFMPEHLGFDESVWRWAVPASRKQVVPVRSIASADMRAPSACSAAVWP
jgi:5-methylthioadenosine/S-adenosylhomocysteine deaminase